MHLETAELAVLQICLQWTEIFPAAVDPRACFLLGRWSLPHLTSWVSTLPSMCLNQLFWMFWVELGFMGDGQAEIQVGDMSS